VAGVHGRHVRTWNQLTDVPRALRAQLAAAYRITALAERAEQRSSDGTVKLLLSTWDGHAIETVQIPARESGGAGQHHRLTVCISSQAGCALACRFCATGQMGLARNLTVGEIVEQVYLAEAPGEPRRVDNIVFMGMGEPLANPGAVIGAVRLMADPAGYGFSPRRITISTSGLVPQMRRLAEAGLPIRLAVSLHAPNDELRGQLMPINRRYPIAQVLDAARGYAECSGRRVSYEYVMLDNVNDSLAHAEQLADLLAGEPAHVNLIPYNETGAGYRATPAERIHAFARILRARSIPSSIRASRGRDIAAACGQLKAEEERLPVT
jgi:23S rRNA (adenine2503-C2)-methyltransferase